MASRNKHPTRPAPLEKQRGDEVRPATAARPYDFGDSMPLPEVIEKDSDSVWAMWSDALKQPAAKDADTQPATLFLGLPELPKEPDDA